MKKIKLTTTALLKPFEYHSIMKETLLSMIDKSYNDNLNVKDDYYGDEIHRLDWSKNLNYDREWIKYIKPRLEEHFTICANDLNYKECEVRGMWYQQYLTNNVHGWHTHGETNFANVYFLDLPDESMKTQFYDITERKIMNEIDVKEGQLLTFPAHILHRSPPNTSDSVKTIISFNCDFYSEF